MSRTVLLVEDNEDDVMLTRRAAQRSGSALQLQVVPTATDAIDYLRGNGRFADRSQYPLPGVVLLDLRLGRGQSGFDVLDWVRQQESFTRTPVVVLTSSSMDEDIERAYKAGANSYLIKPLDVESMQRLTGLIDEYWLRSNRS